MTWPLGRYIEEILHKKGGKRAGWHQSRLAELSRLSTGHVSWIVTGESSGKKGPPEIGIDTLVAIAEALGVKEQNLIDAYKGNAPSIEDDSGLIEESIIAFMNHLPDRLMLKYLCSKPPREVFEKMLEAKGLDAVWKTMLEAQKKHSEND